MNVGVNITANFLGRAYSMGAIYFFVPFYIALLGIDAYGLIAFYTVLLAIGYLADAGLSAAFSREAARETRPEQLLKLLTTVERVLLTAGSIFAVLIFLGSDYIASTWLNASDALPAASIATSLRLMAFTVPLQLGVSLYVAGLYGLQRQGRANAVQALYTTVRGGLVIPALYVRPDVEFFFLWQLASSALMLFGARVVLLRSLGFSALTLGTFALKVLKPVVHFAKGILAITILTSLNTQLDKIVVNRLFTIGEFGYYSLAWTLSQVPVALAAPIMMALFPRMAGMAARGEHEATSRLYDGCTYIVASVGSVSSFGLLFFAPEVLTLWLGAEHVNPTLIVTVRTFSVGGLLAVLQMASYNLCLAYGHTRTSILLSFGTLVLLLPMLIVLSQRFGLAGAAVPWTVLNGVAFLVLAAVVSSRFYRGNGLTWFALFVGLPVTTAGACLALGRLISNALGGPPLAGFMVGTLAGSVCLGCLFLLARRHLGWLGSTPATASERAS